MIRHIVLTRFRTDVTEKAVLQNFDGLAKVFDGLVRVSEALPDASDFIRGSSKSPERIERGYMHGFVIDFDNQNDVAHRALGLQLVEYATGGIDGILVLDPEV